MDDIGGFLFLMLIFFLLLVILPNSDNKKYYNEGIDSCITYLSGNDQKCKSNSTFNECLSDLQKLKVQGTGDKQRNINKAIEDVLEYLASSGNKCTSAPATVETELREQYASFNACFLHLKSLKKK